MAGEVKPWVLDPQKFDTQIEKNYYKSNSVVTFFKYGSDEEKAKEFLPDIDSISKITNLSISNRSLEGINEEQFIKHFKVIYKPFMVNLALSSRVLNKSFIQLNINERWKHISAESKEKIDSINLEAIDNEKYCLNIIDYLLDKDLH